jgi:hypothetical protein
MVFVEEPSDPVHPALPSELGEIKDYEKPPSAAGPRIGWASTKYARCRTAVRMR